MQSASNILVLHVLKLTVVHVFETRNALTDFLSTPRKNGVSIGLVPTMGALHEGHLSLIYEAQKQCDLIVVSVFVNPTQFDNPVDLDKYPRTLANDIAILEEKANNCIVFTPTTQEIYGNSVNSEHFDFGRIATKMEGKYRSGHFDGVGTVLKHFFDIVQPNKAFFGKKDYQQLLIVKKLVNLTQQPVAIVGCPISREENGLARSSRNKRLSESGKEKAGNIYKILKQVKSLFGTKNAPELIDWAKHKFEEEENFLKLEYFEIANADTLEPLSKTQKPEKNQKYRAFVAAYAENVRLIDNIALN